MFGQSFSRDRSKRADPDVERDFCGMKSSVNALLQQLRTEMQSGRGSGDGTGLRCVLCLIPNLIIRIRQLAPHIGWQWQTTVFCQDLQRRAKICDRSLPASVIQLLFQGQ